MTERSTFDEEIIRKLISTRQGLDMFVEEVLSLEERVDSMQEAIDDLTYVVQSISDVVKDLCRK